jgi:hypothetical protein
MAQGPRTAKTTRRPRHRTVGGVHLTYPRPGLYRTTGWAIEYDESARCWTIARTTGQPLAPGSEDTWDLARTLPAAVAAIKRYDATETVA